MKLRCRFHGFTLLELLVVIAIIAILAAILLPVLNKGKQSAHRAACLNDLKQIITATHLYADDNHDFLPFPNSFNSDPKGPGWLYNGTNDLTSPERVESGLLWPYLKTRTVFLCPADISMTYSNPPLPRPQQLSSYCMNSVAHEFGRIHELTIKLGTLRADGICYWETDSGPDAETPAWNDACNQPVAREGLTSRHNAGGDVACFDAHVEWMKQSKFDDESANTPGRLWCSPSTLNGM